MEEGKILVPQAFADITTSSVQNVIQGDQSSNKPVFLQEWPFFLHVCKKIGKKNVSDCIVRSTLSDRNMKGASL